MAASDHARLAELLSPKRLTHVVDIGANPVEGPPPYRPLLDGGLCRLTGFEPHPGAFKRLQQSKGPNETYLPFAVGDGTERTLYLCASSSFTSTFAPDLSALSVFGFDPGEVKQERIRTHRLDDIAEVAEVDFLKIDIQAGELAVFTNGRAKLKNAVAVQTELQFVNLYEGQPSFGQVDLELRAQGFIPHCFAGVKRRSIAPLRLPTPKLMNQLIETDLVYVRDFVHADRMDSEQLKHLSLIAHVCYRSFDLASRGLALLEKRRAIQAGALREYIRTLNASTEKQAEAGLGPSGAA